MQSSLYGRDSTKTATALQDAACANQMGRRILQVLPSVVVLAAIHFMILAKPPCVKGLLMLFDTYSYAGNAQLGEHAAHDEKERQQQPSQHEFGGQQQRAEAPNLSECLLGRLPIACH